MGEENVVKWEVIREENGEDVIRVDGIKNRVKERNEKKGKEKIEIRKNEVKLKKKEGGGF